MRRPYIRYVVVVVLLLVVYLALMPLDHYEAVANTAQQLAMKSGFSGSQDSKSTPAGRWTLTNDDFDVARAKDHYKKVFDIFARHNPDIKKLEDYKDGQRAKKKAFDDKLPIYTNEELYEFLQVSPSDLEILRSSHRKTVRELPSSPPPGLYKGSGIVTVSGKRYMPVMLTTLRALRKVSPHLPIEVFVADQEEYEADLCEKVLPTMNARCVVLEDVFGRETMKQHNVHGYQYKVMSILASSFENVIFVDADSIPLNDIEPLLLKEPFTTHGYVLWPDYWFRTTSPHFYDIADITLGERVRGNLSETDPKLIPQADRKGALPDKSTESGQILISKSRHYKSLLLAVYYNLNGYKAYYQLFTQGSGGEGDKETYLAAAEVLGDEYYQVKQDTRPCGRFEPDGFKGVGMLQMDPHDDYLVNTLKVSSLASPRVLFMHLNYPKLNPRELFKDDPDHFGDDDKRVRFYGKPSEQSHLLDGKDIELDLWKACQWQACDLGVREGIVTNDWKQADINELCDRITDHVNWLQKTHNT
uniref:ARAD1C08976p n=1 Tax=Blastobotrys adeninivorans TaxID=409370 RepID=A0A060T5X4_BLAAD